MRRLLFVLVFFSPLCYARVYQTNFAGTESPICEGGSWQNGKTNGTGSCAGIIGGIDWNDMAKQPGFAYNVNGSGFSDGTAIVTGAWGATQYVRGVAKCNGSDTNPEIELRVRSTIAAHSITGYEMDLACNSGAGQFVAIVRWNGPNGNFTVLTPGNSNGVSTGDVVEATAVGCVLNVYVNRALVATATDCTYSSGAPGIGSEQTTGPGTDNGWLSFYASDEITWLGILSPSRAMLWSNSGLQATFPDGETTPNPWTPPTRTQCSTLSPIGGGSDDAAAIVTAVSGCGNGTYVLLNPGTFTIASFMRIHPGTTSGRKNVTIRGSGPMSTTINMVGGTANIQLGASQQDSFAPMTNAAANFVAGASSVIVTTATPPSVGQLAYFSQCDTGVSQSGTSFGNATSCVTGTPSDNGGLFVCAFNAACQLGSGTTPHYNDQNQYVTITSVTNSGGGTFTIGFTPGYYMNNWAFARGAQLNWLSTSTIGTGYGLEGVTVAFQSGAAQAVSISGCFDCWVKGNRFIGAAQTGQVNISSAAHNLVSNNYFYMQNSTPNGSLTVCMDHGSDSDDLIINNILTGCYPFEGTGFNTGNVIAYNFSRDNQGTYNQLEIEHHAESSFLLHEGNQYIAHQDDDTWGTHHFNTDFRNYFQGWDNPFVVATPGSRALQIENFARFENVIGNILGSSKTLSAYSSTSTSADGVVYILPNTDTVATNSLMRWGNCDAFNNTCRFVSGEVPTSLAGNAAPLVNPVPPNNTLPPSFFMSTTAHPSGGTNLSWWKVCTAWTVFPTSCNSSSTPPFPPHGPDVSSGPYTIGTGNANDIPATVAWKNLPIDTTQQQSYTITGSNSFSGGIETVAVSGLPAGMHLMGPMRISGGTCDTGGVEVLITSNSNPAGTPTTISFARGSSCSSGTILWPQVRQFDERIYSIDTTALASLTPSSLSFGNQQVSTSSSSQQLTFTNGTGGTITISSIVISGTNSGDFSQSNTCSSSLGSAGSCFINVTFTPTAVGSRSAAVVVTSTAPNSPSTSTLTGTGILAFSQMNGMTVSGSVIVH